MKARGVRKRVHQVVEEERRLQGEEGIKEGVVRGVREGYRVRDSLKGPKRKCGW